MKTSKILQDSVKNLNENPSKKAIIGSVVKSVVFIFMLSLIIFLSSCAVEMRTPRHNTSGVVIESHVRMNRPERRKLIRIERYNRRSHHDKYDNR